ncbi:prepilin peptidase, partial [Patescibacteria group bacterium]|nr:prepilin peptidase [Patescibacteria group bacterium]
MISLVLSYTMSFQSFRNYPTLKLSFLVGFQNVIMQSMDFLIWFFVFILGTIIGSFLNVVILRYNTGKSIASGKSACFSCAKRLSWYE